MSSKKRDGNHLSICRNWQVCQVFRNHQICESNNFIETVGPIKVSISSKKLWNSSKLWHSVRQIDRPNDSTQPLRWLKHASNHTWKLLTCSSVLVQWCVCFGFNSFDGVLIATWLVTWSTDDSQAWQFSRMLSYFQQNIRKKSPWFWMFLNFVKFSKMSWR